MVRGFRISTRIHEDDRLIVFNISGEIDSRMPIDKWIETFASLAEPWKYNRLLDYRRADGLVDIDELARFAAWWDERSHGVDYSLKAAVIVNNAFDAKRVHVVARLFPRDRRESFSSLDDALTWLNEKPANQAYG